MFGTDEGKMEAGLTKLKSEIDNAIEALEIRLSETEETNKKADVAFFNDHIKTLKDCSDELSDLIELSEEVREEVEELESSL